MTYLEEIRRRPIALSIRQPWANRILFEGKDIENRDWPTRFRGLVLIHTGKKVDDGYEDDAQALALPRGGIVGAVEIVDCVERSDSQWFNGKYGFVLRDPCHLVFIPCNGKLGFFTPQIDVKLLSPERKEPSNG